MRVKIAGLATYRPYQQESVAVVAAANAKRHTDGSFQLGSNTFGQGRALYALDLTPSNSANPITACRVQLAKAVLAAHIDCEWCAQSRNSAL